MKPNSRSRSRSTVTFRLSSTPQDWGEIEVTRKDGDGDLLASWHVLVLRAFASPDVELDVELDVSLLKVSGLIIGTRL